MALYAMTSDANALHKRIRKAIDKKEIRTWSMDEGGDLLHVKVDNHVMKGWFRFSATATSAKFRLIGRKDDPDFDKFSYAWHHGKLTQMLLNHFPKTVTGVRSTPFT